LNPTRANYGTDATTAYASATDPFLKRHCYTRHICVASLSCGSECAFANAPFCKTSVCTGCRQTDADAVYSGGVPPVEGVHGAGNAASVWTAAVVHACS
jgi:hypothetical protein